MKLKLHCVSLCLFFCGLLNAQVTDNFDDSNLLQSPVWGGQVNFFTTSAQWLRSNNPNLNTTYYISTPCVTTANCQWLMDVKLLFNTSSLNYVDLVVISDSADVTKMKNGYFIRMGSTADDICFYKTLNGVDTKIIDGADNVLNSSNNQWHIFLSRYGRDSFVLQRQLLSGGAYITEGYVRDSSVLSGQHYGLRIKHSTASFVGKHYFDNLYAGRIVTDTVAPLWDSLVLIDKQRVYCVFNENCDSLDLLNTDHYTLLEGGIHPSQIDIINKRKVILHFALPFQPNTFSHLMLESIRDKAGNALLKDTLTFYYSRPDTANYRELLITEIMADPDPIVGLPAKEYVEIYNPTAKYIQLSGCQLHDATGFKPLPSIILAPDSFVVLYSIPSLNNAGDYLSITNQNTDVIHIVHYTDAWYGDPKKSNGGWSIEMIQTDITCGGKTNWHASMHPSGGTPGRPNSIAPVVDVNGPEVLSIQAINDTTLYIVCSEEVDSAASQNATLKINGRVITHTLKNYQSGYTAITWLIAFTPAKDSIYNIQITGLSDCSNNKNGVKVFELQWPSMSNKGELIFNEILFNPKTGGYDFLELYNNSKKAFDLSKHFIAVYDEHNQYKSIDRLCDSAIIVRPYQYVLISANPGVVCSQYQCGDSSTLYLPFSKMPSLPDEGGHVMLINMNGKIADSLYYLDDWHFPLLGDKNGVSLERISFTQATNSSSNWHSAASTAGYATPGYQNSQAINITTPQQYFKLQSKIVSPDEDGYEDLLVLNYNLPAPDYLVNIVIYDTEGRLIKQWLNNRTTGTDGFLTWDGTDQDGQKAGTGIYILQIEGMHPNGGRIREKMSCVVAARL